MAIDALEEYTSENGSNHHRGSNSAVRIEPGTIRPTEIDSLRWSMHWTTAQVKVKAATTGVQPGLRELDPE